MKLSRGNLQAQFYQWVARYRAERIITVSDYSKQDIVSYLGVPPAKISVIPEAADPLFQPQVTEKDRDRARARHALPDRFFFYVGGWEERKNIPFLVRGFAAAGLPDVALVLAGGKKEQRIGLTTLANELGVGDRLHLLDFVEDEDLSAFYSAAVAFVYPSEYEGFGLQLCESMAQGCPTLAANATCLPEILGDGGELFSLENNQELTELLRRVASDNAFRSDLSRRAANRSLAFSWRQTAEQTLAVYRELITANPRSSP